MKTLSDFPHYEYDKGIIYQGDCLSIMPLLADKSVDLVLTDPPYGVNMGYDVYEDTEENWFSLMDKVIPEMLRIGKMVIFPSCQIKRLDWFYKNYKPDWLLCWYKGSVGCAGFMGFNDWEPHLVYGKNNTNMHDYFKATPEPQKNGHPCQKPVEWARWIISRATKEGDIILDPFMGSGTTGVACKELNRNFIGIEISPEYFEIAKQRIKNTTLQYIGMYNYYSPRVAIKKDKPRNCKNCNFFDGSHCTNKGMVKDGNELTIGEKLAETIYCIHGRWDEKNLSNVFVKPKDKLTEILEMLWGCFDNNLIDMACREDDEEKVCLSKAHAEIVEWAEGIIGENEIDDVVDITLRHIIKGRNQLKSEQRKRLGGEE